MSPKIISRRLRLQFSVSLKAKATLFTFRLYCHLVFCRNNENLLSVHLDSLTRPNVLETGRSNSSVLAFKANRLRLPETSNRVYTTLLLFGLEKPSTNFLCYCRQSIILDRPTFTASGNFPHCCRVQVMALL